MGEGFQELGGEELERCSSWLVGKRMMMGREAAAEVASVAVAVGAVSFGKERSPGASS